MENSRAVWAAPVRPEFKACRNPGDLLQCLVLMHALPENPPAAYRLALRAWLGSLGFRIGGTKQRRQPGPGPVGDLAGYHVELMVSEVLPSVPKDKQADVISAAGRFLAATLAPLRKAADSTEDVSRIQSLIAGMAGKLVESASANRDLLRELEQSKRLEAALRDSERIRGESLAKSELLREQMRWLSRKILTVQEDERRKISRELHDVVAQALLGINLRLANLKTKTASDNKELLGNIAATRRLVAKSAEIVHRFARSLRPAALDDLGLVPALHGYLKQFSAQTGVRSHLTSSAGVEKLEAAGRTALFRVAQEALANVARHARASRVDVDIRDDGNRVVMRISDDGVAFSVAAVMSAKAGRRLGILGMRERLEMLGGSFLIESAPGIGTTVTGAVPFARRPGKSGKP